MNKLNQTLKANYIATFMVDSEVKRVSIYSSKGWARTHAIKTASSLFSWANSFKLLTVTYA